MDPNEDACWLENVKTVQIFSFVGFVWLLYHHLIIMVIMHKLINAVCGGTQMNSSSAVFYAVQ